MRPTVAARSPGTPQIRKTLARAGAYGGTVPIGTHRLELVGRGRDEVGINVGCLAPLTSCAAGHGGWGAARPIGSQKCINRSAYASKDRRKA
jgi:hypothetical protein